MKTFSIMIALVAVVWHAAIAIARTPPIEVGQPFPDLVLPQLDDGQPGRLSDYRPKPVVLHIFASW
jgi:hypothetical protein